MFFFLCIANISNFIHVFPISFLIVEKFFIDFLFTFVSEFILCIIMEQEKKKNISWISILINKYTVLIFFFLVYVTFFDEHNLIKRFKNLNEIGKLNSELDIYQKKIQDDRDEIYKLLNDTEYLEKYAREKYFMRRPDEDVFIFRDSIQTEEK